MRKDVRNFGLVALMGKCARRRAAGALMEGFAGKRAGLRMAAGTLAGMLLVTVLSVVAFPSRALAEDRQGADGWKVSFDGKALESNFTSGNMADEINLMQPGDSVELTISIGNTFSGQADWYMKNEVLSTLEDAGDAAGGAYDYLLTYTDTTGETTTLYSSEKFGGEGRVGGVGLHGATVSLDDYFYLDRMSDGEGGVIKLKVALDGETLVNDYQNTFARLQMDFATELVSTTPGTPTNPTPNNPGMPGRPGTPDNPGDQVVKTGDQTTFMASMVAMLVAGLVILVVVAVRIKHEREEAAFEASETGAHGNQGSASVGKDAHGNKVSVSVGKDAHGNGGEESKSRTGKRGRK